MMLPTEKMVLDMIAELENRARKATTVEELRAVLAELISHVHAELYMQYNA